MIVGRVTVSMSPVKVIMKKCGVTDGGAVQRFHTNNVARRIIKYMPYRSGTLATKSVRQNNTEIVVNAPYARYQYFGKVMVDSITGKGPAYIPNVGFRFRRGATLKATDRDLEHDDTFHALAGPFWDRRLVASERKVMQEELQDYIKRRATK